MKRSVMARTVARLFLVIPVAWLAGCKQDNKFVPPPPPQVSVAAPLRQSVRGYMEATGNTEAVNTVNLVARVEGFLTSIDYQDGAPAKRGDSLFVIEQLPYQAKLQQAQATLDAAKAALLLAQTDLDRQQTLFKQDVTAARTLDTARATRDADQANVEGAQAGVTQAAINLGYTHVAAPFDGIVSRHLVSAGELVGATSATQLATITQLDPIYVSFNISEQDVLRVRANLAQRRLTLTQINQVPIEVGLMNEAGFPHAGHLDYVAPGIDPSTGTLLVRGIFDNPTRALLPGFFTRIRIPSAQQDDEALLVPSRIIGSDQSGSYVLALNKDDVVEQRSVQTGLTYGQLVVVTSGLQPDDRVVLSTTGRTPPGTKVVPQPGKIEPNTITPDTIKPAAGGP